MWVGCGGEVVSVCWRHTTMLDGTWVCFMRASGVDVRTLGGTRGGAPAPWGGFFVIYRTFWGVEAFGVVHKVIVKREAQIPACEPNSNV
jgi:hypothetical protein